MSVVSISEHIPCHVHYHEGKIDRHNSTKKCFRDLWATLLQPYINPVFIARYLLYPLSHRKCTQVFLALHVGAHEYSFLIVEKILCVPA